MNEITPKTNKVAVISGAFGYVGLAVAKRLSEKGFAVAMLYNRTSQEDVEKGVRSLSGTTNRAFFCDLSDENSVTTTFNRITEEMGDMVLSVHAAGKKPERKKLLSTTAEDMKGQIDTNVVGSFNFLTSSARALQKTAGVLIGITTIGVLKKDATKSLGAYIPAKYAVQGMLAMLKDELTSFGVRVYAIAPGFMPDGMNRDIPRAFVEMLQEKSKTKTLAKAEDIAEAVVSLYENKEVQLVDGLTLPIAPEYL